MPSLKPIRKRIVSAKKTAQITKAMKMVSAAKLRRAQEAAEATRPYARKLQEVVSLVAAQASGTAHTLLVPREKVAKIDFVVVASDRGLCGAFNGSILRAADRFLVAAGGAGQSVSLICVGRRVVDYYKKRNTPIVDTKTGLGNGVPFQVADSLAHLLISRFESGASDKAVILYNEFRSALSQVVTEKTLLPITRSEGPAATGVEHQCEPTQSQLLAHVLPKQVGVQVHSALLNSVASEHGARMTAMESATKNGAEMIARLTLKMNRARQAIITTELMEIVSGKEALEG